LYTKLIISIIYSTQGKLINRRRDELQSRWAVGVYKCAVGVNKWAVGVYKLHMTVCEYTQFVAEPTCMNIYIDLVFGHSKALDQKMRFCIF